MGGEGGHAGAGGANVTLFAFLYNKSLLNRVY